MAKRQSVIGEVYQFEDLLEEGPFGSGAGITDEKKVRAAGYKGPIYDTEGDYYEDHPDFLKFEKKYAVGFEKRLRKNLSAEALDFLAKRSEIVARNKKERDRLDSQIEKAAGTLIRKRNAVDGKEESELEELSLAFMFTVRRKAGEKGN